MYIYIYIYIFTSVITFGSSVCFNIFGWFGDAAGGALQSLRHPRGARVNVSDGLFFSLFFDVSAYFLHMFFIILEFLHSWYIFRFLHVLRTEAHFSVLEGIRLRSLSLSLSPSLCLSFCWRWEILRNRFQRSPKNKVLGSQIRTTFQTPAMWTSTKMGATRPRGQYSGCLKMTEDTKALKEGERWWDRVSSEMIWPWPYFVYCVVTHFPQLATLITLCRLCSGAFWGKDM